jgi:hypothetical protein
MAFRKRRSPAPGFRQPAAYNPITGYFAPIGREGIVTRVAMMQVIEADTHANYLVCRGFDPESERFLNSVCVAKPYGVRGTFPYVVAQILACAKARTRLGDTPGVAAVTTGHPADLDEEVGILTDDEGNPVAWIEIGDGERGILWAKAQADWEENGTYPSGDPRVSCKRCARDGSGETGDAFWVYLPRNPRSPGGKEHDADPAVYTGYVVSYKLDSDRAAVCTSEYLHMQKIKDIRIVGANDTVPTGWHEADGSSQTGNAGTFNLIDFKTPTELLGDLAAGMLFAAMPRHESESDPIGSLRYLYTFDGLGCPPDEVYLPDQDTTPTSGEVGGTDPDGHHHTFDVGTGVYRTAIVFFIQRYK